MDIKTQDILIGSILGDGHLDKLTKNGSRWIIKYDDKYFEYLKWLWVQVSSLNPSEIKLKKNYHQHYFFISPSKEIGLWRKIFYPKGKKIVPKDIKNWFQNPLSLAIWYMDDGSLDNRRNYHRNATIATFCFSYKECALLAKVLKLNFGIKASVHKSTMRGTTRYRLYIVSEFMDKFITMISPYVHPIFGYKIDL